MLSPPRLCPEIPQDFRRRVSTVEKRQFFDGLKRSLLTGSVFLFIGIIMTRVTENCDILTI